MAKTLARDLSEFQENDQLRVLGINKNETDSNKLDGITSEKFQNLHSRFENLDVTEIESEESWEIKEETKKVISFSTNIVYNSIPGIPIAVFEYILLFVGENWFLGCIEAVPDWIKRVRSEYIWKQICLKTFQKPSFIPITLVNNVPKKYKSWYLTGKRRPRVKFSGVYVHRHTYIRDRGPQNMWSVGNKRFLQIAHYRYACFLPNGRLCYASTPIDPSRMLPEFQSLLGKAQAEDTFEYDLFNDHNNSVHNKRIFSGKFKVTGKDLKMVINLHEYSTKFCFELDDLNTITAMEHQLIRHNCTFENEVETKISNELSIEDFELIPEHNLINYSMQTLYRFEREWKFHPLF